MPTIRPKGHTEVMGSSNTFNVHALSEVIGGIGEDYDTWPIRDLEVLVNGEWKDMHQAFKDRDLIPNNENTHFSEPKTEEDRKRGYYF